MFHTRHLEEPTTPKEEYVPSLKRVSPLHRAEAASIKPIIDIMDVLEDKKNIFADELAAYVQGKLNADEKFNEIVFRVSITTDVTDYMLDRNSIVVPTAVKVATEGATKEDLEAIKLRVINMLSGKPEGKIDGKNIIVKSMYPMIKI